MRSIFVAVMLASTAGCMHMARDEALQAEEANRLRTQNTNYPPRPGSGYVTEIPQLPAYSKTNR